MTETWRLPSTLLPEGERRDLWVADGLITPDPIDGAESLPGRFALPGLVDAHCHLAVGVDREPLDRVGTLAALLRARDQGVLLVRDVGAPHGMTLDIRAEPDLPPLVAAGRWLAPLGGFYPTLHDPVPAPDLVVAALAEVARGAIWVKIVTDWPRAEGTDRRVVRSYDTETLRRVIDAVHAAGARVAAHAVSPFAIDLVGLGVDSVEHGEFLDTTTLRVMAERGIAWTPTASVVTAALPADAPGELRRRVAIATENLRELLPAAVRLGVTVLAGTDTVGTLADEASRLVQFGMAPIDALRACTTAARAFLGAPGIEAGASADVLTFDADPRDDPAVLAHPAAILLRGHRIR
jgi:imidazolonepropionase-like amidohydrolase